jgi:hypothetical protein
MVERGAVHPELPKLLRRLYPVLNLKRLDRLERSIRDRLNLLDVVGALMKAAFRSLKDTWAGRGVARNDTPPYAWCGWNKQVRRCWRGLGISLVTVAENPACRSHET